MKIHTTLLTILILIILPSDTIAQDDLPENTIARLGKGTINDSKYVAGGTQFAVATSRGICIYNAAIDEQPILLRRHKSPVTSLALTPDSNTLASADQEGVINLWHAYTLDHQREFRNQNRIDVLTFDGTGKTLVAGNFLGSIDIWDTETGMKKFGFSTSKI